MTHRSFQRQLVGLVCWLAATFTAGGIGAVASASAGAFYKSLSQPSWAPPAWLFGPVWSVLYILIGVAAWLVWRTNGFSGASTAFRLFGAQLLANALWTWLFFVWHLGAISLAEIIVLWLLIAATVAAFWPRHRIAGLLLMPYLAWVGFASALTFSLWRLNPTVLG
jgi:benzodiazapine receptor